MLLLLKNGTIILFTSGDLDNGKYIDKFKKNLFIPSSLP